MRKGRTSGARRGHTRPKRKAGGAKPQAGANGPGAAHAGADPAEDEALYGLAQEIALDAGYAYTDPRTGETTQPVKRGKVKPGGDPAKALIEAIAMDIGKEIVAYIEVMYPAAIQATPATFKLSLRNLIHNEIMAAIAVSDEGAMIARLQKRQKFRRDWLRSVRLNRGGATPSKRQGDS